MLPVVVVGAGLAGLASAVRLAKAGHAVEVYEATDRLGGSWAAYEHEGVLVDEAPGVVTFPGPWRDVFRKSGRTLEAELARSGAELVPAPPATYAFADGSQLEWPTERGAQFGALEARYGTRVAEDWRDLVDGLDDAWQLVRRRGLEAELEGRDQLPRPVRERLQHRRTVADLADDAGHPHLTALVRSVAHRLGSDPETTPAWCATALAVERTFGRWIVSGAEGQTGRGSVLTDALADRLGTRRVPVHRATRVEALAGDRHRIRGVRTAAGDVDAARVLSTVDPWQLAGTLLPPGAARRWRRRLRRLRPAAAPHVTHLRADREGDAPRERVDLDPQGRPVVTFSRPVPDGTLHSRHDHRRSRPDPSAGVAWDRFGDWLDRPPVSGLVPGLHLAGPWSPGGSAPWAVVLSGALASYATHDALAPAGPGDAPVR